MTNMNRTTRQNGMTMWGFLVLIVGLGFFIFIFLKLWPVYYQQFKVRQALQNIKIEARDGMTAIEIRRRLAEKFNIDSVDIITEKEVRIEATSDGLKLIAEAEVVKPLFGNLSLLIVVYESVDLN